METAAVTGTNWSLIRQHDQQFFDWLFEASPHGYPAWVEWQHKRICEHYGIQFHPERETKSQFWRRLRARIAGAGSTAFEDVH